MILKTPFGYIDLLHTWEGWTLIGAVLMALAVLAWWMEWGKVKCPAIETQPYFHRWAPKGCLHCHGTGRVRRGWISGLIRRVK